MSINNLNKKNRMNDKRTQKLAKDVAIADILNSPDFNEFKKKSMADVHRFYDYSTTKSVIHPRNMISNGLEGLFLDPMPEDEDV